MPAAAPKHTVVRFSSSVLPEQGRDKALEELRERGLVAFRFTPTGEGSPQVDFTNRVTPGLRVLTGAYAGVRHEGVPAKAGQQGADDLTLCLILRGTSLARRRGREIVLSDGDAVLVTAEDAVWSFTSPSSVKVAGLRMPRAALASLVPDLEQAAMRRIARDVSGLRLLRKYLELVADDEALAAPASQRLIASHFYDLSALAIGAAGDAEFAASGSVRAVRFAAIKADIIANLQDCDLHAATVATRNRVTVRYLHKLFENDGVTYSEFVLRQRLGLAFAILRNPLHARRTISSIAFELGFNDLSYFNRTFRRHYNATPSEVRHGALRDQFHTAD